MEHVVEDLTRGNVTEVKVILASVALAAMCVSYFEVEDGRALLHVIAAIALLAVLALKVAVLRRCHRLSHLLPILGISVFGLLALTWVTSAGDFLGSGP